MKRMAFILLTLVGCGSAEDSSNLQPPFENGPNSAATGATIIPCNESTYFGEWLDENEIGAVFNANCTFEWTLCRASGTFQESIDQNGRRRLALLITHTLEDSCEQKGSYFCDGDFDEPEHSLKTLRCVGQSN